MRSLCMLKTEKLDVIKLHVDTCACTVGLLKQDQRWRSAASLSQQSACPRFYLRIRSSLLYLTAEVGRPLLLHDGSCRPLEAERCSFQNWLKSVPLFTKKKTMFSVLSSADWVSALCTQDEEEFLRCQGPLQIPPQLPGTFTDTDNRRAQQTDTQKCGVKVRYV